jgi:phosphate transport system permease protein
MRREQNLNDLLFYGFLKVLAFGIIFLLGTLVFVLLKASWPIFSKMGPYFFILNDWNPVTEAFGALPFIFGTVVTSLLALLLAVPVSVGIALFITELSHSLFKKTLGFLVEMLAAIPSIIYGLWGLFILVPFLRTTLEPFLAKYFGFLPLFQGTPNGVGILAAAIVLAIMIVPTVSSVCREVFQTVPQVYREGALALGSTKWEMIYLSIIKTSRSGIWAGAILGLARALGETMAVTMVIGNRPDISKSTFSAAQTMASLIANEYNEASNANHLSALIAMGLGLLLVSLIVNAIARFIIQKFRASER